MTSRPDSQDESVLEVIKAVGPTKYPDLFAVVVEWCTSEDVTTLYELRRNGAGVQVVYNYEPNVYRQVLSLISDVVARRADIKGDERKPYITLLVASGLVSGNQAADLMGVSKATVTGLKVPRPSRLPVKRMGGTINVASVPSLLTWWEARTVDPTSAHGRFIATAVQAGTDWPVVARFTARTVSAAKKAAAPKKEVQSAPVFHEGLGSPAGEAAAGSGGHPAGSSESAPVRDFAGFPDDEPEFTLKAAPFDRGDAYVRASDLLAQPEADDGSAGHADGLEAGVFEGFEGDLGEPQGSAGRGAHPFLQP